ncbi:MAG: hypothetical protein IPM79_11460 [Polyangiaceae bacterium]|nr:hypothetical protein [Polyangiaceae bacterium]
MDELPEHLKTHWPALREQLLTGTYQPSPVRRHGIPKSGGGVRELGIPTVVDRFIQQAILQVLGPRFDSTFSQYCRFAGSWGHPAKFFAGSWGHPDSQDDGATGRRV